MLYRSIPATNYHVQGALLSTLHRFPQLARYVEAVNLGAGIFDHDNLASREFPYHVRPQAQVGPRSDLVQAHIDSSLDEPAWNGRVADIWFSHWITQLPNLKLLEYETRSLDTLLPALIRRTVQPAPGKGSVSLAVPPSEAFSSTAPSAPLAHTPLAKREEICIQNEDSETAVSLQAFQDLFLLPRLRTFRGRAVAVNTTLARGLPRQSTLQHAYLEQAPAEAAGLEDLLQTCPALQTLRVCWGLSTVGASRLNLGRLGRALRDHGAALEVLDLDYQTACEAGETEGVLGSLLALRRLKYLAAQQDMLRKSGGAVDEPVAPDSPASLLPESLESLDLYSYECRPRAIQAVVQAVLASRRLIRLKRVQLWHSPGPALEWDLGGWRRRKHSGFAVFYR